MTRYYISVAYKDGGQSYTYHLDAERPPQIGTEVIITGRGGHELNRPILSVTQDQPSFPTKAARPTGA